MRVEWAMACRYCEVVGNEISMIGGNRNQFTAPEFPIRLDFWLAFQVFAPRDLSGPDVQHTFRARVLAPDFEAVYVTEPDVEFLMPFPPEGVDESNQVVAWNIFFDTE